MAPDCVYLKWSTAPDRVHLKPSMTQSGGGHNLEPLAILGGLNVDPLTFSQQLIARAFKTFQLI